MGVEMEDAFKVAELLGVRTFLTEFISYKTLSEMIMNRLVDNGKPTLKVSFNSFSF